SGTATSLTSRLDPVALTAVVTADHTTIAEVDYYQGTAPAGGSGSLKVTLQSKRLSLPAPLLKVYDANPTQLASTSLSGYAGGTVTATVSVTPGQTYFIMVDGANNTASGAGAYGLSLNFGTGASPAIPTPNTQTANGNPLSGGGGQANRVSQEY